MVPYLGESEQLLLLAVLRLGRGDPGGFAPDIARELETRAGRTVSRGHLYTTFDRLEDKGLIRWKLAPGSAVRDGLPRRLYTVTPSGVTALRATREALRRMWRGLDAALDEPFP